jgi:NAD(P)-dependent dehydrogenase (short-subunit alcohol dehydrogenase family)
MNLDLSGRRALVTGSTRGIGFATAGGLAQMGAEVVIHGRTSASVESALADLAARVPGARASGVDADIAEAGGVAKLFDVIPRTDILVNNAGVYYYRDFFGISEEDLRNTLDLNLISGIRLVQLYLPAMLESGWGRIVNVSSEAGVFIPPDMIHYGIAKAAQLAFSRGAAELTAGTDVTVNAVLPGPTLVDSTRELIRRKASARGIDDEAVMTETFTVRRPTSLIRRYASPEEVANVICYLCSPAASATNGAPVRVDGGIVRTFI